MFFFKKDNKSKVHRISPQKAKEMLESSNETELIDVRTVQEFKQRRIKGSKNMPLDSLASLAPKKIESKTKPLIVYCLSGARSAQASSQLLKMGFETIYDMGGINSWPYETTQG